MIELSALTIESVFGCVPACAADNLAILSDLVGRAKAESIVQATGFATRRVAAEGQGVFDLVLPARRIRRRLRVRTARGTECQEKAKALQERTPVN